MKMKIMDDAGETILEDWGEGSGLQIKDTDQLTITSANNNIHYLSIIIVLSIVILNLIIISFSIIIYRLTTF